jgi:iron complex outermembrane receptor protein
MFAFSTTRRTRWEVRMRGAALALMVLLAATFTAAAEIHGTITDSQIGKALAGARVEVLQTHAFATSDASGGFSLPFPDSGPATVVVSHPGYRVERLDLAAAPKGAIEVRLAPVVSYSDRVEVTSTRAREGQDPVSLTNIPKETVAANYWGQDPAIMLSEIAPSFFAYNDNGNGIGYSYYWVRGFNQARTRVTLNGAPLNDAEDGELYFIDLADFLATAGDIQMQRGVFGLSGIGGAIDVTTTPAQLTPSFQLDSGAGSFNTRRLSAIYDSGLIDGTWALTARYSKLTTDGYRDQSWVDMWNYFLSLSKFGERSRLRIVLFGGPEHTHLAYEGVPKSVLDGSLTGDPERDRRFNPLTFPGETDTFTQQHYQIVHELAITPATQFTETLFAFTGSGYYDEYKSGAALVEYDLPDVTQSGGTITTTDLVRKRDVEEWDAGWVPTLSHTVGNWTLTLKGELRFHSGRHVGDVEWAQVYPPEVPPDHRYYDYQVDKRTSELAGSVAWKPNALWTLTLGLEGAQQRYQMSHDKLKGVEFSQAYDFLMPRAGVVLHAGDGADLYFNVARGMQEPPFRYIYDPEDYYGERVTLRPEDLWDWEAGVSYRNGNLRGRANLFLMNFANEIVYAGKLDSSGVPVYGNGARSRHRGVELEASYDPSPIVGFDGSVSLSHNTFVKYREYNDDGSVNVYDGKLLAGYPQVLASLTARTSLGAARLALSGRYVGSFYLDNTENDALRNPAFAVVDARLGLPLPRRVVEALGLRRLEADVRINNLLDRQYTSFGYVGDNGDGLYIPAAGRNAFVALSLGL